ncbi:MAG TPA: dicarboxylate/amino acid:cation symporter [Gemmatimonadaceae bacterium]
MKLDSPSVRALLGLALGLAVGGLIVWSGAPAGFAFARAVDPIGTMWVNALRMTVVPLVVALLIHTLASNDGVALFGRLGRRTLVTFVVLLVSITIIGLMIGPPVYSLLHVDPNAAASLRAASGEAAPTTVPPSFASWFTSLVPTNIMKAAADGAMLPLIIFAVLFGLALGRAPTAHREALGVFFRALSGAMLTIVQWVLLLAPIGAFALAVTLTTHLGGEAASAVLFYIVTHALMLTVVGALLYLIIPAITRTPVARYARALLPAQVVVVATRSSLSALPAMLDTTQRILGVPGPVTSFVLPLGVSLLRANTGLSWVCYALFLGKLYGISLGASQLLGIAAVSIAMSFSVPGIPSGGLLIATPYFMAVGLPPQGIGILIALDAIPDVFKTLVIVMSHVSSALIVARFDTEDQRPTPPLPRDEPSPVFAELTASGEVGRGT